MTSNYLYPDFFQKRATESQIAYEMRVRPFLHHREDAQADAEQAHTEFRGQQEARTSGSGIGLMGDMSPQARAQAVKAAGVQAGEQRVAANGHLFWEANALQPGLRRIYASEIAKDDARPGSPLLAWGRANSGSSGEGWTVTR
jgi:hypothetical protein